MVGWRGARVYFLDIHISGDIVSIEECLKGGGGRRSRGGHGWRGSALEGAGAGESAEEGGPVVASVGVAAGGEAVPSPAGVKGEPVRVTVPSRAISREFVRSSTGRRESEGGSSSPNASMMEPTSLFRDVLQPATVLATAARSASILERYSAAVECDSEVWPKR